MRESSRAGHTDPTAADEEQTRRDNRPRCERICVLHNKNNMRTRLVTLKLYSSGDHFIFTFFICFTSN